MQRGNASTTSTHRLSGRSNSVPSPSAKVRALAAHTKAFVVPELNLGQMVGEVERAVAGSSRVVSVPHAGGTVHRPEVILEAIEGAAR